MHHLLNLYNFNLQYAHQLVADIPENLMTFSPSKGLENHPAWTLGHLVMGSARVAKTLDLGWDVPPNWKELFDRNGPGDPRIPLEDIGQYPSKIELLAELTRQHKRVANALILLEHVDLNKPVEWRFFKILPTIGDVIGFMCITHEAMHLSQLAAWRRAMNLPSALGAM